MSGGGRATSPDYEADRRSASVSRPTSRTASAISRWCTEASVSALLPAATCARPSAWLRRSLRGMARPARRPRARPSWGGRRCALGFCCGMSRVTRRAWRGRRPVSPGLRVLFCGITPGQTQGASPAPSPDRANRFWKLLDAAASPGFGAPSEQERLLGYASSITNLVERRHGRSAELVPAELRAGALGARRQGGTLPSPLWPVLGLGAYRVAFRRPRATGAPAEQLGLAAHLCSWSRKGNPVSPETQHRHKGGTEACHLVAEHQRTGSQFCGDEVPAPAVTRSTTFVMPMPYPRSRSCSDGATKPGVKPAASRSFQKRLPVRAKCWRGALTSGRG